MAESWKKSYFYTVDIIQWNEMLSEYYVTEKKNKLELPAIEQVFFQEIQLFHIFRTEIYSLVFLTFRQISGLDCS